ncbi:MAG: hypothetical protein KAY13_05925, partial [Zoogloea sp.]|nr:hypothetical protein [Zoogloea sp.]
TEKSQNRLAASSILTKNLDQPARIRCATVLSGQNTGVTRLASGLSQSRAARQLPSAKPSHARFRLSGSHLVA